MVALALPRLGVGREVIGQWESLLYVGYILGFGWLTGLLQAYLVTIRLVDPGKVASFSRLAVVGVGLFSALLLAIAAGLHGPLFHLLRLGEAPPGWWYFFLFLLTRWPGLFFEQVLLIRGKPIALAAFGSLSALGLILSLLLPLYQGYSLTYSLFILSLFAGVKGLFITAYLAYKGWQSSTNRASTADAVPQQRLPQLIPPADTPPRSNVRSRNTSNDRTTLLPDYTTTLLKTAWPLILYASVGALVTAFDPWFVNYWYSGDEAIFATFRYGARELPFLAAITNGMMAVVLPRISESPADGLALLKNSSRRLFHWIFGGTILLMITASWWWPPVFTQEFADSLPLFKVYLLIIVSRLLFPMVVITSLDVTMNLPLIALSELVCNIILSILLTPIWGLQGIIIATLIADIINKIFLMKYLYYRTSIKPSEYIDANLFIKYTIFLFTSYLASVFLF